MPISGRYAAEAQYSLWGVIAVVNWINDKGGVDCGGKKVKVKLLYRDSESKLELAQSLTESLITRDKVHFLLSPYGSDLALGVSPIAEKYGVLMAVVDAPFRLRPGEGRSGPASQRLPGPGLWPGGGIWPPPHLACKSGWVGRSGPGRQIAEPGLPLSPAGARLPEERDASMYNELRLYRGRRDGSVCLRRRLDARRIGSIFRTPPTFSLGVSIPNI